MDFRSGEMKGCFNKSGQRNDEPYPRKNSPYSRKNSPYSQIDNPYPCKLITE